VKVSEIKPQEAGEVSHEVNCRVCTDKIMHVQRTQSAIEQCQDGYKEFYMD